MASDAINELTKKLLCVITKKELLEKVLQQKDGDKNVEINSQSFEKTVKTVLKNQYNLEAPFSNKLDFFAESFRKNVRRHADAFKKRKFSKVKIVQQILEKNETYYGDKIQKIELQGRKRPREPEAGTSQSGLLVQYSKAKKIKESFDKKSKSQRMRDSQKVRENAPNKGSIGYSFVQNLRFEGHHKAATVVDEIRKNPGVLGPRLAAFLKKENHPEKWSNLDVLAEFFDRNLTVAEYKAERINANKSSGISSWPCWNIISNEKRKCCPEGIIQTGENSIKCPMQNVSDSIHYYHY